jgi:translation initiation factor IF-2
MPNEKNNLQPRPPIVVVMGHVDHGKTTLLDYVRSMTYAARSAVKSGAPGQIFQRKNREVAPRSVAEREAGGITQAVGAYEITHNDRRITFIDTPGHEAFSAMRSRGALIADLAILVVAADEGVKPQTKEAIKILEETKTPFVVGINKIDRTNGSMEKAKNDLLAAGVLLEGFGGQVSYHGISAKTGDGVGDLLDLVLLAADMEGLTYDPASPASGYVLEARRDPRRGIEATVIVKNGILKRNDPIATPGATGTVKILEDFMGNPVESLAPSAPALVIGFDSLPGIGEEFSADISKFKNFDISKSAVPSFSKKNPGGLVLMLKASDAGSLEALSMVARAIGIEKQKNINIVQESVGDITDSDVRTAAATGAIIVAFKNRVEKGAQNLVESQHVTVIASKVVYDIVKAIEDLLTGGGLAAAMGTLDVLAVFNQEKLDKQLVGGRITSGVFRAKAPFEIFRGAGSQEPLGVGKVLTLRENKTEITQAENGKEIGVIASAALMIEVGDILVIRK